MLSQGVDVAHPFPGFVKTTKGEIILVPEMDVASAQDLATLPLRSRFASFIYFTGGLHLARAVFFASCLFLPFFPLSFFSLSVLPYSFFFLRQESQTKSFFQYAFVVAVRMCLHSGLRVSLLSNMFISPDTEHERLHLMASFRIPLQ